MRRIDRIDPDTAARIPDHRHIVAFRNVLAHGYDALDPAVVWSAIRDDVPRLLDCVTALLAEADSQDAPG